MKQGAHLSWPVLLAWLWLAGLLVVALLAPYLPLPYPPAEPDLAHIAVAPLSGSRHWLGTDSQGQDALANLLFGARTIVFVTFPAALVAALAGALLGGAAGFWGNTLRIPWSAVGLVLALLWWWQQLPYAGIALVLAALSLLVAVIGWHRQWPAARFSCPLPLDSMVLGSTALLGAVPQLVLAIAVASIGLTKGGLLALLTIIAWPEPARLVRAQMRRERAQAFVTAAQAAGLPARRVWFRHALPHAIQPLRTALPLSIAGLLGLETTLSFLGIGLPPTTPSWGKMFASARLNLETYWIALYPVSILIITIISLQIVARAKENLRY